MYVPSPYTINLEIYPPYSRYSQEHPEHTSPRKVAHWQVFEDEEVEDGQEEHERQPHQKKEDVNRSP